MQSNPSLGEVMVLGTLEVLLNQALALHADGPAALERLAGKVIRVRAYDPDYIFYCLIERDGIELATGFDGDADIRVRGSAGALIHRALLPPGDAALAICRRIAPRGLQHCHHIDRRPVGTVAENGYKERERRFRINFE